MRHLPGSVARNMDAGVTCKEIKQVDFVRSLHRNGANTSPSSSQLAHYSFGKKNRRRGRTQGTKKATPSVKNIEDLAKARGDR